MVFILRAERAPSRVIRETDGGVSRTFWLWRDGGWVVALRFENGGMDYSCSRELDVHLEPGETVTIVRVAHASLQTMPAPPPTSEEATSGVLPVSKTERAEPMPTRRRAAR